VAKGGASSQKFIAGTGAPRVQIEYDVELYGAQKTVQIPSSWRDVGLSGEAKEPLPTVAERKFLATKSTTFDERMKSMKPVSPSACQTR